MPMHVSHSAIAQCFNRYCVIANDAEKFIGEIFSPLSPTNVDTPPTPFHTSQIFLSHTKILFIATNYKIKLYKDVLENVSFVDTKMA